MGIEANQPIKSSQAWIGMMRVSNAPTVVSNVLVGFAIAMQMQGKYFTWNPSYHIFFSVCILIVYFAGMILNDAFDAKHDKQHRPDRPIPSGAISRFAAWIAGLLLLVAVSVFSIGHGAASGLMLLVLAVLLYTFFHRWFIPAIVFMALCRGLVYLIVANPTRDDGHSLLLTFCLALAFYTAVLTLIGRFENKKNTKYAWVIWLLLLPPLYVVFTQLPNAWFAFIPLAFMSYWIWLAWNNFTSNNKVDGMHRILSGFCLLDCVLATSLEQYVIAGLCIVCFIITVGFHRKILGT
jgi:heme O synthase-like polyprenyltransferase